MARPTIRRLTMADLAILIAGAALSLGLLRVSWETTASQFQNTWTREPGYRAGLVVVSLSLGLAAALVAARAIPPRPRWRAVSRQPGTSACLAIVGHMLIVVLIFSWHGFLAPMVAPRMGTLRVDFNTYLSANRESGAWVAIAWATLALARAWRPEPSWIDRAGRILGVVAILQWIGSALIW